MIAILDYGAGNVRSIANMLRFLNYDYRICRGTAYFQMLYKYPYKIHPLDDKPSLLPMNFYYIPLILLEFENMKYMKLTKLAIIKI